MDDAINNNKRTLCDELDSRFSPTKPSFQRKYRKYIDTRITIYDLFIMLLSILTILSSVVEVIFVFIGTEYGMSIARALAWLMCVLSVLTVFIFISLYHCFFTRYQYCKFDQTNIIDYMKSDFRYLKFSLEVLIHLVFPYPGLEKQSYILSFLTFLRVYRVWPLILQLSDVYQMRHRINVYMAFFNQSIPKYTSGLLFRILLNTKSFKTFGSVAFFLYLSFCYLSYAAMRQSNVDDFDLPTSLYWSMQTSTTLGYGDISLDHNEAYELFISLVVAFIGLIINSLLTGIFAMIISPSEVEQRAIEIGNGINLIQNLKSLSADLIQLRLKIFITEVKIADTYLNPKDEKKRDKAISKMKKECTDLNLNIQKCIQQISSLKWELNDTFPKFLGFGVSDKLNSIQEQWEKRIDELRQMVKKMSIIYTNLTLLCHAFNMDADQMIYLNQDKANDSSS
ncbi:hypothetical protein M9Y10_043171 [Tritrichomonas musculus]|uniref:Potassium channel domain-containing protein n=1 Tax=Tritrichomonas musculus TaxID=1915356 RepID=A0ABR2JYY4_9EUKA